MIISVSDFFVYLHHLIKGDTEYLLKYNELKLIYKTFNSSKYRYITKDRYVTELFLNKMFSLFKNILICFEFLDSTVFSGDSKRKRVYTRFYIESFFSESDIEFLDKFTKDYIIKKLGDSDNPNKTISLIENEFYDFRKKITSANFPQIEKEYNFFNSIYHLCIFNYEGFFSKFDPSFSFKNIKQPSYSSISGSEISGELKDFYYIIASLPKKIEVVDSIAKLSAREKGPDAAKFAKTVQQAINDIYKTLQSDLNSDIILNMIRYIESNPKVKIRIFHENLKIIDEYKKEMADNFNAVKNQVVQQFSESTFQKDVKELFGMRKLQQVEGYNDELIMLLERNGYDIKSIKGLRIAKTFIYDLYEQSNKDVVNSFILEGFFADKEFQKEFSEAFFRINELKKIFHEKEEEICSSGSNSFKTLVLLMGGNSKANDKKIRMTMSVIEERINSLIKRSAEDFFAFGKILFVALNEYKKTKPEKITNIRQIKGGANKEFITSIVNFYNAITKYIKITKPFIDGKSE